MVVDFLFSGSWEEGEVGACLEGGRGEVLTEGEEGVSEVVDVGMYFLIKVIFFLKNGDYFLTVLRDFFSAFDVV